MRKTFIAASALVLGLIGAAPASAAIVVNEVESQRNGVTDWIELANTGNAAVDVSGYVLKDSNNNRTFAIPGGTSIPAGGYYAIDVDVGGGFGLGNPDSARVFLPGGVTELDGYSWSDHAPATYGRCTDGTGPMTWTQSATRGAPNDCPPATVPAWPGSSSVAFGDELGIFGTNVSGLAYQPSGTSAPGVLWVAQNNPSTLYRMVHDGTKWVRDTANGWGMGKQLTFADGAGVPDAEGITLTGEANTVYVSIERNDVAPFDTTSRPSVLRFDVSAAGTPLKPTNEWNLVADIAGQDANEGLESITWVPDSVLVAKGFRDERLAKAYNPADYAGHGTGLFLVATEQDDAALFVYALSTSGSFSQVAKIASPFPRIADLAFDAETNRVFAVCDNGCDGRTATLEIGMDGRFARTSYFARPTGMANLNNEGFTLAPQAECVNGLKPTFYADDSFTDGHAIRTGKINCTVAQVKDPTPTPTPTPGTGGGGGTTPTPQPGVQPDRTAPKATLALKATKTLRRDGKLSLTVTLNERAGLTISATVGKKSLLKATRTNVATGKTTQKLTLSAKARKALRKGQKLTLTVQARDAAGNVSTARITVKVK